MNEFDKLSETDKTRIILGCNVLVAGLAISIGLGYLLGAGAGWIAFGVLLAAIAINAAFKAKKAQ
jgi:hypothetical protein